MTVPREANASTVVSAHCLCCPAETPPHDCRAERDVLRFAYTSWLCYGQHILPLLNADDFRDPRARKAWALLKERQRLPYALASWVATYWSVPGTETPSSAIPQLVARIRDMAHRRRLIWAAQTIAEGAWRTTKPFSGMDAARVLAWADESAARPQRVAA